MPAFLFASATGGGDLPPREGTRPDRSRPAPQQAQELRAWLAALIASLAPLHRAGRMHGAITPQAVQADGNGRACLRQPAGDPCSGRDETPGDDAAGYAAFERYTDDPAWRCGPWTDVYALSAMAYERITGRRPVAAPLRWIEDELPAPEAWDAADHDPALLAAIHAGLALRPADRPQDVARFALALGLPAGGGQAAQPSAAAAPAPAVAEVPTSPSSPVHAIPAEMPEDIPAGISAGDGLRADSRRAPAGLIAVVGAVMIAIAVFLLWPGDPAGPAGETAARVPADAGQGAAGLVQAPAEPASPASASSAQALADAVPPPFAAADPLLSAEAAADSAPLAAAAIDPAPSSAAAAADPAPAAFAADATLSSSAVGEAAPTVSAATQAVPEPSTQSPAPASTPEASGPASPAALPTSATEAAAPASQEPASDSPPAAAAVEVRLDIRPWGEVSIDGVSRGISPPLKTLRLAPGSYRVTVSNTGLPPLHTTLTVRAQGAPAIRHTFE